MKQTEFLQCISCIAIHCNVSVTSWIRSKKRNEKVGGVPLSLHQIGMAVDLVWDTEEDKVNAQNWCTRLGLTCLDEGDHLHVQPGRG